MAGSINSPSVIWVAGEKQGKNQVGATVTVSGYVYNHADFAVDVLHDRLVASGILES